MPKNFEIISRPNTTLSAKELNNPWLEAASEDSDDFGRLLKFVKGKWETGDDSVPDGTEFVAHVDQLARGWVRFEDGKVTDRRIGKVADGFIPPKRDELPDNDPTKWVDKDTSGKPRDPWVVQWLLPLISVEAGDLVTFVTGSRGGIDAVRKLCRIYGHKHRGRLLPIVALRTRSYKHSLYGRIETPDLPVVGWEGEQTAIPTLSRADIAADPDSDSQIPF